MNADQFQQFMAAFQAQQNQFLEKLLPMQAAGVPQSINSNEQSVHSVLLQTFECFDSKKESFKFYRQRFENFLDMKKIISNKELCAKIFLNSIGASNYNMLAALVSPKTPSELTYSELMNTFETHLCPKKNILVSQHKFLSIYQSEHQAIADYIATLRRDIIDCEFISPCECKSSIADIFLRAQFVRGIRDNSIREQILQSEILTFDEIAKKTIALEASKIDSQELSKKSVSETGFNDNVNKVSRYPSPRRGVANTQVCNLNPKSPVQTHNSESIMKDLELRIFVSVAVEIII
jgi:hypothetical protein